MRDMQEPHLRMKNARTDSPHAILLLAPIRPLRLLRIRTLARIFLLSQLHSISHKALRE